VEEDSGGGEKVQDVHPHPYLPPSKGEGDEIRKSGYNAAKRLSDNIITTSVAFFRSIGVILWYRAGIVTVANGRNFYFLTKDYQEHVLTAR
jgi:hypothetical protein